ncbi:hypothetical protein SAMN05216557_10621 [Sphingomonas carotinifaciens]|uniref:Transposase n=1 Tax=Sphingomonas carotinifaciens TaxID=1166323 RepID=A0A1G7P173_9SPHN|nr:hypothetical protein [Sphingomonas carotinifaciens]SDF79981.1 hypothetical protein SAMN05216557_10621 [Sphingomonas carotinifaciens]
MMGREVAQSALFYGFRLDEHVPVDHLLRPIDGVLDFGFVRQALASSYGAGGQSSARPFHLLHKCHGRFRACDLHRLLFEQVVARCAAPGW